MEYVPLALLLTGAVLMDIKFRKIPNALIGPALIVGLGLNIYASGFLGVFHSIIGLILGIMLLVLPFALGGIGAGDVKLLGAIGAMQGSRFVFYAFLASAIWGGIISIILLCYRKQLMHILKWIGCSLKQLFWFLCTRGGHPLGITPIPDSDISMPYAVPILLGTITILIWGVAV